MVNRVKLVLTVPAGSGIATNEPIKCLYQEMLSTMQCGGIYERFNSYIFTILVFNQKKKGHRKPSLCCTVSGK